VRSDSQVGEDPLLQLYGLLVLWQLDRECATEEVVMMMMIMMLIKGVTSDEDEDDDD
jgi:hypothetical protein